MTFYKKFEGQNTATERLCDVCFGSLRYLKFVAHSMMCVFVKILLRKILRRSSLSQLIRLNDLRLSRLDTYFFFFLNRFHHEGVGHTTERGSKLSVCP